jgi:hypothetical protein
LVCYSGTCRSGAKDDHAHIFELKLADMQAGDDGCQGYTTCSLNIVVEARNSRAVAVEDSSSCTRSTGSDLLALKKGMAHHLGDRNPRNGCMP